MHKHVLRGSQLDRSTLRLEFEQRHQAWPWSGLARFGPYVAKPVMWRRPEQPLVSSNKPPIERHISDRVPVPEGSAPSSSPPFTEWTLAWPSTPDLTEKPAWICGSAPASMVIVAGDTCPSHAQVVRGREEIVMWRSRSKDGGIHGINRLEAT